MLYKGSNVTSKLPEKMGSTAPVKVGTRGTVGSLVMKEIEYFRRCELELCGSSIKPQKHSVDGSSSGGSSSWPNFGFLMMTWRKKKKRGSAILPRICSAVEVSKSHRHNGVPGFTYRNLKADAKNFRV